MRFWSVHVTCIHSPSHFLISGYFLQTPILELPLTRTFSDFPRGFELSGAMSKTVDHVVCFQPDDSMTSTSSNKEIKDKRADSIEAVQEANEQPSLPSIYSIAAAHSLSKDLKQKSLHLKKVKRRHGDYGQFDLTHAWSREDLMDDLGSRYGSGRSRDSTFADESLALARPFVMEPLRTFQVVGWDKILFCSIFL